VIHAGVRARALAPGAAPGAAPLLLVALAACAPVRPQAPTTAPPSAPPAADASYDWHSLVPTPLGTEFAALQSGLHEVLLFHDAAQGSAAGALPDALDADDCYRSNEVGPRFVGRTTTDYLWCFRHDRLERVAAVVRLPSADAPAAFARYCAAWLEHADDSQHSGSRCSGRDGNEAFSANLLEPGLNSATDLAIVVYQAEEH
jgi:hypothetical protein